MKHKNHCDSCNSYYFYQNKVTGIVLVEDNRITGISIVYSSCPGCGALHYNVFGHVGASPVLLSGGLSSVREASAPVEVPAPIAVDYNEAVAVLPASAKASAALSRRCLQHMLRERGYQQQDLVKQIAGLLSESDPTKAIPETLRIALDAIRNFGNFSAHPLTDRTTLQLIDVESGEADWCLEILREYFETFYVRPARLAERKKALNEKLAQAGKPPAQ